MNIIGIFLIITDAIMATVALKWYIATLVLTHILQSEGVKPTDAEMKKIALYVCKNLFKVGRN